jgi:hypothetical protein
MKGLLIFIGGLITGILLTLFFLFVLAAGIKKKQNISDSVQIQYIDVKGRKGNTTLHTGMQKDSVLILVGKPEEVRLNSIGNFTYETWGYKLKNKYVADLEIEFEDGKLKGVRQR